ncbi:MAG: SufE family protein [Candidatus Nealsonbacteria bacterium]
MTIQETQEEIISEFKILDNWMDKYNYLIELGKKMPPIDPGYKTEDNLIKGCQVKTWFHSAFKDGRVFYDIDSGSLMIRGIISLLIRVVSDQKPEDIKNADLYFIDKTDLREIFSPTRANSLWKLTNRINLDATTYETKINKNKT